MDIPIFAGQGTSAANSLHTIKDCLCSTTSKFLLSRCYEAFTAELQSLSVQDLALLDINIDDFKTEQDLLHFHNRYATNAVLSGSSLLLIQVLRYLSFLEASNASFQCTLEANTTVLGFSSGILPACVVASSTSPMSYISNALEAYRLALWIGIRIQSYRTQTLTLASLKRDSSLPWSLVVLGLTPETLEETLTTFNKKTIASQLYLTAVTDSTCTTVSGRPDILSLFADSLKPTTMTTHWTAVYSLYHASVHVEGTREQVIADVKRRNILFPTYSQLKVPIHSTWDGKRLTSEIDSSKNLVEDVIDMLLTQPVNWSLVVGEFVGNFPPNNGTTTSIRLVNVGPGTGLVRGLEKALGACGRKCTTLDLGPSGSRLSGGTMPKHEPIAIVGMSFHLPGASSTSELWDLLEKGGNTVSEIPSTRFKVSEYITPTGTNPSRQMNCRTGNFLPNASEFDNAFFKISPREAKNMDPQQRLLLRTAYEALENAGYVPYATPTFNPERMGCYVGAATNDYVLNLRKDVDLHYSTGTLSAFLSGRISYALQLGGPSMVVDTACSSSNVALYQGMRGLINEDCDTALVGGVNIISSPDMYLGLDRGHFLSPTGQCKPFSASADGYCRSEGCAIFILKRLSSALLENDRIYALIRGIEVNQSGTSTSITHPHAPTQSSLFKRLLESSGLDPARVNVVEAHGTGTQAGDPTELESIRSVFSCNRPLTNPLHIMSIKANIGHLEAASGGVGLAKLLIMFAKKTIPPQISLIGAMLNPRIAPLQLDNTVISTVGIPWRASHAGMSRVAMLNNFGAAGSNTAMIVEEYLEEKLPSPDELEADVPLVFGISAKTDVALEELRQKYLQWLRNSEDAAQFRFRDIAYTATARRQLYQHRIVVCASTRVELIDKLEKARPAISNPTSTSTRDGFVFVFSGQGGQYLGMGRSLYLSSVEFKNHVDECERILIGFGFESILPVLLGEGGTDSAGFEASQTALFALEYALAKLWIWWGLNPTAVIGYSLGEYVALVIANVITLHDGLLILAHRARLMLSRCVLNTTGMLAVHLNSTTVDALIASSSDVSSLTVACYSSPTDCVVSGPLDHLRSLKAILETQAKCSLLDVAFGYHGPAMEPLLHELDDYCSRISVNSPTIPVASNVHGRLVLPGDSSVFDSKYFGCHCVQPVRFEEGLWSLMSHTDAGTWIEVGPHPTVLPMLRANTAFPASNLLLPSIRKQHDDWMTLMSSLAQLFLSTTEVRWRNVFSHVSPSCVTLPSYPFAKSKYWIPYTEDNRPVLDPVVPTALPTYSMLRSWSQYPNAENDFVAIFETPINQLSRWIVGHTVGGRALCPASVYIEQVLAAIQLWGSYTTLAPADSHAVLRGIEFLKPLVHEETVPRMVITTIDCHGSFTVSSQVVPSGEVSIHVRGRFKYQPLGKTAEKFWHNLPRASRTINTLSGSTTRREVFSKRTAYDVVFPRIVEYSKDYQAMEMLTVDNNALEAFAVVKLPSDYDRGAYVVHPVFIDSILHAAGFVANMQGGANDAFICSKIGSIKVLSHLVDNDAPYTVLCKAMWLAEEGIMLAEALAVSIGAAQQIIAQVKGMEFRRVRLDSLRKNLAQAAGLSCPITRRLRSSTIARGPSLSLNLLPPSSKLLNNLEISILRIVSETCDVPSSTVGLNTSLESIGVDSLMYIELHSKLQVVFPEAELSVRGLSCCRTTAEIVAEITRPSQRIPISPLSPSVTSSPRTLVAEDRLTDLSPFPVDDERPNVKQALASVLDIAAEEIEDDAPLDALGLDSLTTIELRHSLEMQYEIELPCDFFQVHSTARSANEFLTAQYDAKWKGSSLLPPAELRSSSGSSETPTIPSSSPKPHSVPVTLQTSTSTAAPLFLIHDGSGLINSYEGLSSLGRTVYGIHNPYFVSSRPWESLVEMATFYATMISSVATGPVILGGWSFGGVVAYEAAAQLHKKGIQVKGLLLIDSPCPTGHVPLSELLIDNILKLDSHGGGTSQIRSQIRNQFTMNSGLLCRYEPQPHEDDSGDAFCPFAVVLRSSCGYNPPDIAEKIPAWLADRSSDSSDALGWNSLLKGRVKVVDIPGHHFEPFHPQNIRTVSFVVAEGCTYLDSL